MGLRLEVTACLVLAGALLWLAQTPPPSVPVANVDAHEGQRVRTTGWAQEVRAGDGWTRFVLVAGGSAVPVVLDRAEDVPTDRPLEVEGGLVRLDGRLQLLAEDIRWTSRT